MINEVIYRSLLYINMYFLECGPESAYYDTDAILKILEATLMRNGLSDKKLSDINKFVASEFCGAPVDRRGLKTWVNQQIIGIWKKDVLKKLWIKFF